MAICRTFDIADSVLVDGVIEAPAEFVFLAHNESSLDSGRASCQLISLSHGRWTPLGAWDWQGVGLVKADGRAGAAAGAGAGWIVLGRDGEIGHIAGGVTTESHLDPNEDTLGPFRGLRRLGGRVLAFGMKREVFELGPSQRWVRCMDGFDPDQDRVSSNDSSSFRRKRLGGINAMALDARAALTAVGMRGEIWTHDGRQWRLIDSPTNVMLKDVCGSPGGDLYCCGLAGTLLAGSGETWRIVEYLGVADLDFCAIAWFCEALYLADGHSVRRLANGILDLVNFDTETVVPASRLVVDGTTLLTVAGKEVWATTDGRGWTCLLG